MLGIVLYGAGIGAAHAFLKSGLAGFDVALPGAMAMVSIAAIFVFAVAIHEGAHALAADRVGLTVANGRLFGFEFIRRRDGWSVRWSRAGKQPLGFVVAYPLAGFPGRRAFMTFIAAGPLANLLCAAAALAIAWFAESQPWRDLLIGFAAVQAAPGLASLVPSMECGYASDGASLLRWWRGIPEDDPGIVLMRLNGLCFSGVRAEDLPQADIDALERGPPPMPFFADWWRLVAARNRGDWSAAAEAVRGFEARFASMTAAERAGLGDLMSLLRAEAAFCEAIADVRPEPLEICAIPARLRWYVPELQCRLDAVRAALLGDAAACRAALSAYSQHAARSFDAAAAACAPALSARIEDALERTLTLRRRDLSASAEADGSPTASTTTTAGV
ncbi:MAG: site-2 protease family protein [Pseudomonadota bacterium]